MRSITDQLGSDVKKEIGEENVAIQHLGLSESPFFAKKVVITTLDTFALNFYKTPALELSKLFERNIAHFEFARGLIYSSLVVFDEFHLFSRLGVSNAEEEESKSLHAVVYAIRALALAGVPVIVMTATMPNVLKTFLKSFLASAGVRLIDMTYEKGRDHGFESGRTERKIDIEVVKREDFTKICEEELSKEKPPKIMVVLNTPRSALRIYNELGRYRPVFLHGKLPEATRKKRMGMLDTMDKTPHLLVATQVVEAGLNLSFDMLLSEACPADRLIQRAGRVARKEGHNKGIVYVSGYDEDVLPYSEAVTKATIDEIRGGAKLDKKLLNKVYSEEPKKDVRLLDVLYYLDTFPQLSAIDAKEALSSLGGFTDAFGIVTGFPETAPLREWAVGLSEAEARLELHRHRKVVVDGKIHPLKECKVGWLLSEKFSINLLNAGFDGIVIDDFDRELGYFGGKT